MEWQKEKSLDDSEGYTLANYLGGDGDWAKEGLAFGAMIENAYLGIYRVEPGLARHQVNQVRETTGA